MIHFEIVGAVSEGSTNRAQPFRPIWAVGSSSFMTFPFTWICTKLREAEVCFCGPAISTLSLLSHLLLNFHQLPMTGPLKVPLSQQKLRQILPHVPELLKKVELSADRFRSRFNTKAAKLNKLIPCLTPSWNRVCRVPRFCCVKHPTLWEKLF